MSMVRKTGLGALARRLLALAGFVAALGAVILALRAPGLEGAFAMALAGGLGLGAVQIALLGTLPRGADVGRYASVFLLLGLARSGAFRVWQFPDSWSEILQITPLGAALVALFFVATSVGSLARQYRQIALREAVAVLALPILFNLALSLGASGLMSGLGRALSLGLLETQAWQAAFGRGVVLFACGEAIAVMLGLVVRGRALISPRFHGLLLAAAVLAAATSLFSDLPGRTALLPSLVDLGLAIGAAAIAQAGLWGIVYLLTGLAMDTLRGKPPSFPAALYHWSKGLVKGGVYGGLFMGLLLAASMVVRRPDLVALIAAHPLVAGALAGAVLFPLAQTIVASADETPPFLGRLRIAYARPWNMARGLVVGLGVALALTSDLRHAGGSLRFVALFLVGALAYAGVDLVRDGVAILTGPRKRFQSWRVHALGALLGGLVAGALGWYFDANQIAVVSAKFWAYVDLDYAAAGRPVGDYTVYALFSKWGLVNLGPVAGGVKLFYLESLSGVINWSLAAPLFGINFFLLSALVQRSLEPVRTLFSGRGIEGLVEQTVRVLRWGLWMAPVIYSFLRMSPEPSWYNQDGMVRSIAATIADVTLPGAEFNAWSLAIFTGLLAYDWLRVLIWFDHMGLRVATLVNLSFVGGDKGDEAAARFVGHATRTRFVPDGIRRFATWAPLLIPFYIPRGADWDSAWSTAENIARQHAPMSIPVSSLVTAYVIAGLVTLFCAIVIWRRLAEAAPSGSLPEGVPACLVGGRRRFRLSNGMIGIDLSPDGRGYTRLHGAARRAGAIDLTRRPTDSLQVRGTFFYVDDASHHAHWSIGFEPARHAGTSYRIDQPRADSVRIVNTVNGIAAEQTITLSDTEAVEFRTLRFTELTGHARRLIVTSYQELACHETGSYVRDAEFNGMHVETVFARRAQAIFARNRLLRNAAKGEKNKRMSPEVMFHAVRLGTGATLEGYEDSRTRFIGTGDLRHPAGLTAGRSRPLHDEGLLATFDPAASLRVAIDLPAHGTCEIVFVNGHARSMPEAAECVHRHAYAPMDPAALVALFERRRILEPTPPARADFGPFSFNDVLPALHLTPTTPRPGAHVMANPQGFGTMVSNEGAIYSFNGNARHNGLTPWVSDPARRAVPGQRIYVEDLASGDVHIAGAPAPGSEIAYGLGTATFTRRVGDTEIELAIGTVPDAPADLRLLTIRNHGPEAAHFRVATYLDMALDESPADSQGRLRTQSRDGNVLLFENPQNNFHGGFAFAATSLDCDAVETVRARVIGDPCRDLDHPVIVMSGEADPTQRDDGRRVAAFAGEVDVPAGGEAHVSLVLGQVDDVEQAVALARRLRRPEVARATIDATERWWHRRLSAVEIETDDPGFDRLVNHWLPYQLLASRLWGRVGPNQRGGAIGFRDQLQDVLPLVFHDPKIVRDQIVLHAGQQFIEGDVLKWWHAGPDGRTGMGQRTRASDPHLWLPYALARYIRATGDVGVLDEEVAYLDGPALKKGASADLVMPRRSRESDDVYGHCLRAIDYALARLGAHGLPLVGAGDWNDGIDTAGLDGRGESVWMGFFLHDVLKGFAALAVARDPAQARRLETAAGRLSSALDAGWRDGRYIIGFDDDGAAFPQASIMTAAWPILSGAVGFERGKAALEAGLSVLERDDRILLLSPAFDERSKPYPGRIADYPAGVRENAAQYTHGASWVVDAFTRLSEMAREEGDAALATRLADRAYASWRKLSPLGKTEGASFVSYGLSPHQQPADIYDGWWHAGRGGWSWYTGSAARMLSSAYTMLGLDMVDGVPVLPADPLARQGGPRPSRLKVGLVRWASEAHADVS